MRYANYCCPMCNSEFLCSLDDTVGRFSKCPVCECEAARVHASVIMKPDYIVYCRFGTEVQPRKYHLIDLMRTNSILDASKNLLELDLYNKYDGVLKRGTFLIVSPIIGDIFPFAGGMILVKLLVTSFRNFKLLGPVLLEKYNDGGRLLIYAEYTGYSSLILKENQLIASIVVRNLLFEPIEEGVKKRSIMNKEEFINLIEKHKENYVVFHWELSEVFRQDAIEVYAEDESNLELFMDLDWLPRCIRVSWIKSPIVESLKEGIRFEGNKRIIRWLASVFKSAGLKIHENKL